MRRRSALLPSAGGRRGSQSEADRVALPLRVDLLARVCEAIETIVLDSTATSIVSDAMVAHMYDPMSNGSENYVAASMLCEDFAIDLESIVLRDRPLEVLAGAWRLYLSQQRPAALSCIVASLDNASTTTVVNAALEAPSEYRRVILALLRHLHAVCSRLKRGTDLLKHLVATVSSILLGPIAGAGLVDKLHQLIQSYPEVQKRMDLTARIFVDPIPLTESEWQLVSAGAIVKQYDRGERILDEGQFNYHLFRVQSGKVQVEKAGKILATLSEGCVFGEMSALGRFETSAAVTAETNVCCHLIDCSFLEQIFLANPEVAYKFTWRLTHSLATRLAALPATKEEWQRKRNSVSINVRRRAVVVPIYLKNQSYRSFKLEESMSVRDVCREVALQTKCKRPHCYSLYMMHSHLAQAVVLQPDQHLYELYKELHLIPGFKLSFSAKPPKTIKRKLEATAAFKQYQCKFSKRAGYLYLSQSDGMWHQHCRFGLVSKFEFPRSRIENIVANGSVAEVLLDPSVAKKGETYKLYFEDDLKCLEAVAIMNNLLQQYQGLQGETGALSCSSGELPSLPAHSPRLNDDEAEGDEEEDFQFVRAIVVESYVPKSKGELALHAQDVIIIHEKCSDGWWIGENGEEVGYLQPKYIRLLYEPDVTSSLSTGGYKVVQGVATKEDWIMVLMGGRETTYAQDEAILQVGDRSEMIYQLSSGKCRINIGTKTVGSLTMDNTFGEISMFLGSGATASVVADEPCVVYQIHAEYLKRLFNQDPGLGARFLKYFGIKLEQRLRERENALSAM